MTRLTSLFLVATVVVSFSALSARAQETEAVVAVVNVANDVKKMDASTLRAIYLGTQTFWDNGQKVTPYQRAEDAEAGKRFYSSVLKMAPSRYRHHWQTQQLSGQGVAPEVSSNAEALVAKVAARSGAVGYILESEKDAASANPKVRILPLE